MNIKRLIVCILLFILIGIQVSNVIAAASDSGFFNTNKNEINQGETLEMTLNISKIKYDKFDFKLSSNLDTKNIIINENVKVENYNNDISINIDKSKTKLDKITFYYKVPEDTQVDTKIELVAQIIVEVEKKSKQDINDENKVTDKKNTTNNTITQTQTEYEIVENKKIEIKIVDNKKNNNQVKPNEQNNNDKSNITSEKTKETKEKQDINLSSNETKIVEETNVSTNKSMPSSKTQSSTFSMSSTNFSSSGSSQVETAVYNGSNNNYLSNIEIEGESLNTAFNKEKTTYFIETTGKTELNVNVEKEDGTSKVYITGNDNLKTGDNKILISVTAQNGDVRYYRVFVTNK